MAEATDTFRTLPLLALKNSAAISRIDDAARGGAQEVWSRQSRWPSARKRRNWWWWRSVTPLDVPHASDVYTVGTRATIRRHHHARPDEFDIMVLGVDRVVFM